MNNSRSLTNSVFLKKLTKTLQIHTLNLTNQINRLDSFASERFIILMIITFSQLARLENSQKIISNNFLTNLEMTIEFEINNLINLKSKIQKQLDSINQVATSTSRYNDLLSELNKVQESLANLLAQLD